MTALTSTTFLSRLRQLRFQRFEEYVTYLQSGEGEDEIGPLVNAITTNLTSFFREAHHFDHLRDAVLEPMLASGNRRIRIWSAGCSTGAEAYSIAMVATGLLQRYADCDIKILATDIDTQVLAHATQATYKPENADTIPALYRVCVAQDEGGLRIVPHVRQLVHFKPLNLLHDWPMRGRFDILFCRNVVIYFDKPTQRTLFGRFADVMTPEGYLYIGHSENLFAVCDRFRLVGKTIYQRAEI